MDFARVMLAIGAFLDREGFPHAIAGGLALHAYGITRATQDLDLVTEAGAQARLVGFLESLGYETLHRSAGFSNHLHGDAGFGRVDVIYVEGETSRHLFREARGRLTLEGQPFPVPRPEHLVAMKVHALKNDRRRALRDLADIELLLRLPGIDRDEVRGHFARAGLLEEYDRLRHDG